jgi:glutaredoxin
MEIILFSKDGCQYCDMMQMAIMKEDCIPDGATLSVITIDEKNIKDYKDEFIEATGSQEIGFPITKIKTIKDDIRYLDYIVGYSTKQLKEIINKRK